MTDTASLTAATTEGGQEAAPGGQSAAPAHEILLGGAVLGKGGAAQGEGGAAEGKGAGAEGAAPNAPTNPADPLDAAQREAAEARLTQLREQHWQDFQTEQAQSLRQHSRQWHQQCHDDPELGGHRLPVSVARAQMALDRFDEKGRVGQWLQESGFGNHPDVLRLFTRIADALGDDKVINGQVVREMPSLEDRMYPHWRV